MAALFLTTALITVAHADKKKKKSEEEITQVLAIPKDPPLAITVDTDRLSFDISPLSAKGLLTHQIREGLKALLRQHHTGSIVALRAFVAGTGDMRTVQRVASEVFTEKKLNLPVMTVIQVGALPMVGAQVVLETAATEKRSLNPNGLAFFSGQQSPTADGSLKQLRTAVRSASLQPDDILRVTCFLSSLEGLASFRPAVQAAFPSAGLNFVETERAPARQIAECEAIGRLRSPAGAPLQFLNPPALTASPNYAQIALVSAPRLVFSGLQLVFRDQEADMRLAFDRLKRALAAEKVGYRDVAVAHLYSLSNATTEKFRKVRADYYEKDKPPASTLLIFEGLPSLDATFGLDVIAVAP